MKTDNIKRFVGGWVVGNFEPSLVKTTDFEIAVHTHPKGYIAERHYQKTATEYNIIVSGHLIANGEELRAGDIFVYDPLEVCDVVFVEETVIVCFKVPSVGADDKVIVND